MSRTFFLFAVMLFVLAGTAPAVSQPVNADLRYDGVYMCEEMLASNKTTRYRSYIRFYPEGDVIAVSSTGRPEELKKWFSKEHAHVSKGKLTIQGNRISFSAVSSNGAVDYSGEIDGDQIRLNYFSHMNQRRGAEVYLFVKW